jgi:selenocysteine-specific elongation factor
VEKQSIEVVPGGYRRAGFTPVISEEVASLRTRIMDILQTAPVEPPSVAELRVRLGGADVMAMLRSLAREESVVQVEADRFYATTAVEEMLATIRRLMGDGKGATPAQLREALGMSRKYLIPFLEYCDRRRITERRGDSRVLAS